MATTKTEILCFEMLLFDWGEYERKKEKKKETKKERKKKKKKKKRGEGGA